MEPVELPLWRAGATFAFEVPPDERRLRGMEALLEMRSMDSAPSLPGGCFWLGLLKKVFTPRQSVAMNEWIVTVSRNS